MRTCATVCEQATAWVRAACSIKDIDPNGALAGEEWVGGPYGVLRSLHAYGQTLTALAGRRSPVDGLPIVAAPGGRRALRVLPHHWSDRLLISGHRVEVWFPPGVAAAQIRSLAGRAQLDSSQSAGVGLVLGAANFSSIPVLDVMTELMTHGRASLLKLSPISEPLLRVFRAALAPLIDADVVRVHADDGLGPYLIRHEAFDHIHLTGSEDTYRAILVNLAEHRSTGAQTDSTPVTAELGGVSPIIVVPGDWTAADLRHQAEHVATMRLQNNGYNCVAGQVLMVSADWPLRAAFLDEVRAAMRRAPRRTAYYPGSDARMRSAAESSIAVEDLNGAIILSDVHPGDAAFRTEFFAPVLAVTAIAGMGIEYLRRAVDIANTECAGNLGANVIALPRQVGTVAFQRAVADLRYGTIGVNAWTAVGFATPEAIWGAYSGDSVGKRLVHNGSEDVGSGIGVVHNALLLDSPERTVVTGPFRAFPRSVLHGEASLMPTPPWFVTARNALSVTTQLTEFAAAPRWWRVPPLILAALRG